MSLPLVCPYYTNPVHYFDDKNKKPCTGLCGHTVCLQCITVRRFTECPACGLNGAFNQISVNYTSIALIKDCRKKFFEKLKEWVNAKNRGAAFCSKLFKEAQVLCSICVDPVKIPRICLTCDREILFKKNVWTWTQSKAIILTLLQRVMCSNCAIDNHKEKGHEIVEQNMNKKLKKLIMMALAQKVLDMFKDAIENKNGVIDCFLRRLKIGKIGQNLLKVIEELEYIGECECGYLGELIKRELMKKYMENVDEKVLDLFGTEGNACDCSEYHEKPKTFPRDIVDVKIRRVGMKPQVFASGCPFNSWKMASVRRKYTIFEKEFSGDAATIPPNEINCPLCVYNDYSQHRKKEFLLESGVSIIAEFCKTEMITLHKCCLKCLDRLNSCQFLLSCGHRKKKHHSYGQFTSWYRPKERFKKRKSCYQNCFMKNSTLWNFVIINHMMADNNLHEVIVQEIEETVGFVDCQLQKVRMKQTIGELYNGLHSAHLWGNFDHWSQPIEMDALFKSFKEQWNYFRFGNGERETATQCICTVIWKKISENKLEREKHDDLETTMVEMARYSMTEEIHGCPMEYSHGIELNKDVMKELKDANGFEYTGEATEQTLGGNAEVNCLIEQLASNSTPFAHLYCQNEEKQLFDNKVHQPYTGTCEHTICSQCVEKTYNGDCPVCGDRRSFESYQRNEDLLREIRMIKENAWEIFDKLWNNETDFADVLKLSRHVPCPGCALAPPHGTEKFNSSSIWEKNCLKKTNGIFLLKLLEDVHREGKNCEVRQTEIQKNRRRLLKVLEGFKHQNIHACGYDRDLIKIKLIEKLIETIDESKKKILMLAENPCKPIKETRCPLCAIIDFLDCATNGKPNQNEWMTVLEHLSSNQLPRFEKCCIRCLFHLNNRYSAPCQTETEVVNIRKMGNAIGEGIENGQLKNFNLVLTLMRCKDRNVCVNDKKIWENLIMREYFFCLLQTITFGLSKVTFACYLRKIRFYNLAFHFLLEVCDVWQMNNQYWLVCWKFIKKSSMLKNLNFRFKKLKNDLDKEESGTKCKCTVIWERNQNMIRKFGHEYCEEKRKHQDLEGMMEEMARYSLKEDLDGCPMNYNFPAPVYIYDLSWMKK